MTGCGCEMEARNEQERQTLRIVLGINAVMFLFEIVLGWLAQSTGLIADSLDMLADALVYAVSLYAVGRAAALQDRAAILSGVLQMGLTVPRPSRNVSTMKRWPMR
jgi:Co/Zn/Cd efflux system component